MADDVVIGSASVQITGDYSGLEKSFTESQNLAQAAGQKISTALESGADGAKALTTSLFGTADAMTGVIKPTEDAESRLQELLKTGMSAAEAFATLQAEAAKTAQVEDQLSSASAQTATSIQQVGQAAQQATPNLQQAADASKSLVDSMAEIAVAAIAAAGLQRLGEESVLAYGRLQQLTTSLDLLGAGAKGAAAEVEILKNLSIQLAVPFENLAAKAQGLAAQFGTGEGLTAVLIAAGNAAAGAGKSFDSAAGSLERIGVTGAVSARQLFALGLNWEDMARSMGVSIEEAHDKLKKGGQSALQDVSDVIDAINTKFGDAAERQAQNTLGVWTNLKNQAEFIFQEIGQNLDGILDVFTGAMKVIASGLVAVIGGTQLVTIEVIGMVREAIEAIKGLGSVALAAMKGDLAGAAIAAAAAYNNIKTTSEYTNQSLEDHAKKTAQSLLNIWMDSSKKISATFTPTGGTGDDGKTKAIAEKIRGYKDLTESLAVWLAMEKMEIAQQQDVVNAAAKYNEVTHLSLTAVQYLQLQVAKANGDFATFDALTKNASGNLYVMADAAKMAAINVSVFDRSGQENQLAISTAEAKTAFDALAPSIDKSDKLLKTMGKDAADTQKQLLAMTPEGKLGQALEALGFKWDKVTESTDRAKVSSAEYVARTDDDLSHLTAAWQVMNSEVSRLSHTNLPAAINMQDELVSSMQRAHQAIGQIYQAQEKLLQLEIQKNSEEGKGANAQLIALTNVRLRQQALITQTQLVGQTYANMVHIVDAGFTTLGQNIGQVIVQGGDFWKTWHETLNNIEGQLLGTLIGAILKMAEAWLINLIFGKAAYQAAGSAEIGTSAAVAGAAAFASTAAIPIVGPILAPGAGALAYATVLATYLPLAQFSEGGMVPEDMIAMVHKGEYVLPAEKTAQAMLGGGPKGGGEIHVHFDFGGAHFSNGLNDTQVKTVFDRAFRMSKLAGALPAGRFPQ